LNYLSQVTQAQGIGLAISSHRSARNYCMGTLYWQLNDCWPVTSWSSVDYFYNPKALWYESKNDYKTFLIVPKFDSLNHSITIVSDSIKPTSGILEIELKDFGGKVIFKEKRKITINPLSATIIELESFNSEISKFSKNELFLHSSLLIENKSVAEDDFYFLKTKDLKLQEANLNFEILQNLNSYTLKLKSDKFIKSLIIEADADGMWTENYFNLMPNESKTIQFTPYNFDSSKKVCFKMKYFAEKDVKILNSCNK
jgi:beta-mannosidase